MTTEPRAAGSWEAPGRPITLTVYSTEGRTAVPKRALTLAQELLARGLQAIKAAQ